LPGRAANCFGLIQNKLSLFQRLIDIVRNIRVQAFRFFSFKKDLVGITQELFGRMRFYLKMMQGLRGVIKNYFSLHQRIRGKTTSFCGIDNIYLKGARKKIPSQELINKNQED
jgi:hypothetical protein